MNQTTDRVLGLTYRQREILVLALALALIPIFAHAQTADAVVNWFNTNIARGLINAGVIIVAICFLLLRFSPAIVCGIAGGGLIYANRAALAGLFGAG